MRVSASADCPSSVQQLRRSSKEMELVTGLLSYQDCSTVPKGAGKEWVRRSSSAVLIEVGLHSEILSA